MAAVTDCGSSAYVAPVLALARSGATAKARERYLELGLGDVSRAAVSASLYTDIKSLDARIAKDLALQRA